MSNEIDLTSRPPLIRLLDAAFDAFVAELSNRVAESPYSDVRVTHGCVFGNIDPDGTRLTDLAERAHMTKQSVGEVVSELERLRYLDRVADPRDGRAKIIRLTERGRAAQALGREVIDDIEREWAERYGGERIAALREALEAIAAEKLVWFPGMSAVSLSQA
jgi:DNA-binding MarR family transcriptional regulator